MDIKQEYIKQAIKEWEIVEKAIQNVGGIPIDLEKLLDYLQGINGIQTQNYDGDLFDIEQARTIFTVDFLVIHNLIEFDTSEDLSGEWIGTNIEELRKALN